MDGASTTEYELPPELRNRRAALAIAHPGHELRVHGWLELARPVVFVLTDGSGHTGQSRLSSTTRLLTQASARPGPIYGRFTDIEFYAAILDSDLRLFIKLAEELAEAFVRDDIEYVAGASITGESAEKEALLASITKESADKEALLASITKESADKDALLATITKESADKEALLADITKEAADNEALLEDKEAQLDRITKGLADKEAQLTSITNTLGWRLLSLYGPIKYRFVLPAYKQLQKLLPDKKR